MQEEKCGNCNKKMLVIGQTGKGTQVGKLKPDGSWMEIGMRPQILYQCPECKDVRLN